MVVDLPSTHPVQVLSDRVYSVVASSVGGPRAALPAPRFGADSLAGYPQFEAVADIDDRRVVVRNIKRFARAAARIGRVWDVNDQGSVLVLVHEHLHMLGSGHSIYTPFGTRTDRGVEEAIVSAVASDLLPRVVARISRPAPGFRYELSAYWDCVNRLRVASTVGSGARSWRGRLAREWRIGMLHASPASRRAVLVSTGTNPVDVCPNREIP